jgi:hypothetical protein
VIDERGIVLAIRRHRIGGSGSSEIPVGRGRALGSRMQSVLNRNSNSVQTLNLPLRFSGIRQDVLSRWDFSLIKHFRIYGDVTFQFRADVFNAWSHASFSGSNPSPIGSAFGTITGAANGSRQWQLSGRIKF